MSSDSHFRPPRLGVPLRPVELGLRAKGNNQRQKQTALAVALDLRLRNDPPPCGLLGSIKVDKLIEFGEWPRIAPVQKGATGPVC